MFLRSWLNLQKTVEATIGLLECFFPSLQQNSNYPSGTTSFSFLSDDFDLNRMMLAH